MQAYYISPTIIYILSLMLISLILMAVAYFQIAFPDAQLSSEDYIPLKQCNIILIYDLASQQQQTSYAKQISQYLTLIRNDISVRAIDSSNGAVSAIYEVTSLPSIIAFNQSTFAIYAKYNGSYDIVHINLWIRKVCSSEFNGNIAQIADDYLKYSLRLGADTLYLRNDSKYLKRQVSQVEDKLMQYDAIVNMSTLSIISLLAFIGIGFAIGYYFSNKDNTPTTVKM